MIREKPAGAARRERRRRGMTLIEVVIAMALLAFMLCAYMHLQYTTLEVGRISSLRISGTIALRSQLEQAMAIAFNNTIGSTSALKSASIAKGLISFLRELRTNGGDVRLVNDAIVYTFPVPPPGGVLEVGDDNLYQNTVGTLTVYLNENSVPAEFTNWANNHDDGLTTPNHDKFDMNGDGEGDKNFSDLFTDQTGLDGSDLNSLPVYGEIRYYNSEADKARGTHIYLITRYFIINGDSFRPELEFTR